MNCHLHGLDRTRLKSELVGKKKEKILHISRSKLQSLAHTHWQTELSRLTFATWLQTNELLLFTHYIITVEKWHNLVVTIHTAVSDRKPACITGWLKQILINLSEVSDSINGFNLELHDRFLRNKTTLKRGIKVSHNNWNKFSHYTLPLTHNTRSSTSW